MSETREPVIGRNYRGFLFDMDGTIINSLASAERAWSAWAQNQGLNVQEFLPTIHGKRSVDTIRQLGIPGLDPVAEAAAVTRAEIDDVEGIVEIKGAKIFLESLPKSQWAIVTSAPKALAIARLEAVGLPVPDVFVTSEDVQTGKPNPDGYLIGAKRLACESKDCLVFEDADVGIRAGLAAGSDVLVITATHRQAMTTGLQTVLDYAELRIDRSQNGTIKIVRLT